MCKLPSYVHPLERGSEELPELFTFPFRYTPHPLCVKAASLVALQVKEMGIREGKMYGVLVAEGASSLYFLAAYSGQLYGSYDYPWFVPPIVNYLDPDSHFQKEQREIMALSRQLETMREDEQRATWQKAVTQLRAEREAAVAEAKRIYDEGKRTPPDTGQKAYIRLRQFQKANIHRAKQLHKQEIAELEAKLAAHNAMAHDLFETRKQRSEDLQQWLFKQFNLLNGRGERQNLLTIFSATTDDASHHLSLAKRIPSGAGECCAPKLLQAAYTLGLRPVAMAEFWLGTSHPGHYRQPGAFFPACRSKCHPILTHMLQGLHVEPDPAIHYNKVHERVRIVWEDDDMAVICKPEGWVSIPGKSDQPCLIDECYRLWPHITGSVVVHRLDMDTSGIMLIGKNPRIHRALSIQFEQRQVQKRYVALLEGIPDTGHLPWSSPAQSPSTSIISLPLGPDLDNLPRQRVDHETGKEAITAFEVMGTEQRPGSSLGAKDASSSSTLVTRVRFYPHTGRTHQLRVHSASPEGLNAPILGDRLYGHFADRMYLHAEAIDFEHPVTHEHLHFEVPCPF